MIDAAGVRDLNSTYEGCIACKIIASGASILSVLFVITMNAQTPETSVVSTNIQSSTTQNDTGSLVDDTDPEPEPTEIAASVQRKGLDFSYEASGTVQQGDTSITVTYIHTRQCGSSAASSTARQEWQAVFDLTTSSWTHKVRELTSCLNRVSSGWIDYSTTPSQFTIETSGNTTILKADSLDTDGSVIVDDALVVTFENEGDQEIITESINTENQNEVLTVLAGDGIANLRSSATTESEIITQIPNGNTVIVLDEVTNSSNQLWYKVEVNNYVGWIFAGLLDSELPETTPNRLTEAEQFKQVVLSHTSGLFAIDRVNNMPVNELYAYRHTLDSTIEQGLNGGVPLSYIKLVFANELQAQHGMDERLATNLSNGIIDGIVAWNRGERPDQS